MVEWSGLNYSPLDYESSLSVIWRFAWRNSTDASQLMGVIKSGKMSMNGHSFSRLSWLSGNRLAAISGWQIPNADEVKMFNLFNSFDSTFLDSHLRICPICLEYGYHSYWYQFRPLIKCPVHFCRLVTYCCSCGEVLPEYRFSKALMQNNYLCVKCSMPVSGAEHMLNQHLDFRSDKVQLKQAFDQMLSTIPQFEKNAEHLRTLVSRKSIPGKRSFWRKKNEFYESFVFAGQTVPTEILSFPSQQITVLHWRIKMRSKIRTRLTAHEVTRDLRKTLRSVYISTLNFLRKWLYSRIRGEAFFESYLACSKESEIKQGKYPIEVLAYYTLRFLVEHISHCSLDDDVSQSVLRYELFPANTFLSGGGRVPRLAWRALFIGMFAVIYWDLYRLGREGIILLTDLPGNLVQQVPVMEFGEDDDWHCGAVFFPHIPGLPLAPYKSGTRFGTDEIDLT